MKPLVSRCHCPCRTKLEVSSWAAGEAWLEVSHKGKKVDLVLGERQVRRLISTLSKIAPTKPKARRSR